MRVLAAIGLALAMALPADAETAPVLGNTIMPDSVGLPVIAGSTREYCEAWIKTNRMGWTRIDCVRYPAADASRDWVGEYAAALQAMGWNEAPSSAPGSRSLERAAADPECVERLSIDDASPDDAPAVPEPWRSKFASRGIDVDAPIDGTLMFIVIPLCGVERTK
jgi:hypothetical protein